MMNIKKSVSCLLAACGLCMVGCAGEIGEESSSVEAAQTFGAGGIPMPESMTPDSNDVVETYSESRAVTAPQNPGTVVGQCLSAAKAACEADGGVSLSRSPSVPGACWRGEPCTVTGRVQCLFKIAD
jgi:hypothetical protein